MINKLGGANLLWSFLGGVSPVCGATVSRPPEPRQPLTLLGADNGGQFAGRGAARGALGGAVVATGGAGWLFHHGPAASTDRPRATPGCRVARPRCGLKRHRAISGLPAHPVLSSWERVTRRSPGPGGGHDGGGSGPAGSSQDGVVPRVCANTGPLW